MSGRYSRPEICPADPRLTIIYHVRSPENRPEFFRKSIPEFLYWQNKPPAAYWLQSNFSQTWGVCVCVCVYYFLYSIDNDPGAFCGIVLLLFWVVSLCFIHSFLVFQNCRVLLPVYAVMTSLPVKILRSVKTCFITILKAHCMSCMSSGL